MNYWYHRIIVGAVIVSVTPTWAATIVERRDTRGDKQKIIMEKQHARIETSNSNFYTLIDLEKEKAYMVNADKKELMVMNIVGTPPQPPANMPPLPKSAAVKAELVKQGKGPEIAGFTTVNYQVIADDKVCSENYFSSAAVKVPYIKAFIDAMYQMSNSRKPKGLPVHPCQQAHDDLEAQSMKLGVPMKSIIKGRGKKGDKVRYEIISIQTDVKVPEDTFTLPKKYQLQTEAQMLEQQQQAMRKWQERAEQPDSRPRGEDRRYDDRYLPPPRGEDRRYDDRYLPPPPRGYEDRRYDDRYLPPPPRGYEDRRYDDRYLPPPPRDEDRRYDDR
jgi:translation elongation factor P/translation initiation factor 5A